jgi:serine/threonine protein kinase
MSNQAGIEATAARCASCGARLLPGTPGSQCPACLLGLCLDPEVEAGPPTETGNRFGDYELLEPLGSGGMGRVYRARQISLNRIVALKMIHSGRFAGEHEMTRFRFEAEAAARLDHPNIVPVFGFGEEHGQAYLTLKLIEGKTLSDHASFPKNRDGVRAAVETVLKLARALNHAHQRGILHRDLKPSNILLETATGEPYLTDFGLARTLGTETQVTGSRDFLGSIAYMAPEQFEATPSQLTSAVDIYALGCVLFEILTGVPAHPGDTPGQVMNAVLTLEVANPRSLNRHVDVDLALICLKCLEKNPEDRYASAAMLVEDLQRWLRQEPVSVRRLGPASLAWKWVRRQPLKFALVLTLGLAIIGPLLVAGYYYIRELPYHASVHQINGIRHTGDLELPFQDDRGSRCTENFDAHREFSGEGRLVEVYLTNTPPAWISQVRLQVFADHAGGPDPSRSPVLTNGSVFRLRNESFFDRAFYFGEVGGFATSNLLAEASNAAVVIRLVKR